MCIVLYSSFNLIQLMTKKITQSDINSGILKQLGSLNEQIKKIAVSNTTSKVVKKTSEWTTLVESKKGERISLAPEDKTGKYTSRGVVVSRYAKSIFVPAENFGQFVADVEVAYAKLQKDGYCPTA